MRPAIYVAAVVACAAIAPEVLRSIAACACAVVLESLPYLAGIAVAAPLLGPRAGALAAYAGCGCGRGPSARSIPAAIAACLLFGPWIAIARITAATFVARLQRDRCDGHARDEAPILTDLAALAPTALLCGIAVTLAPFIDLARQSTIAQIAAGAIAGFFAAPCALGGVALAATLHAQSPLAAYAVLGIAGIIDVHALRRVNATNVRRDGITYALLTIACALVAYARGATLVHPRLTLALVAAAIVCGAYACRSPFANAPMQRLGAFALCAAVIFGSVPPPANVAAVTLDDAYIGERLDFTGRYVERNGVGRVVRYAITCCRADARPMGVRLSRLEPEARDAWIRVRGVLEEDRTGFVLQKATIVRVAPPADPFIYR